MAEPIPQGTMIVPPRDPWDEAFASYRQALVDYNGDGIPDAVVPVGNRERQAIARRAMAGRDPTLSPQERSAVAQRAAISEQNSQAVEQGVGNFLLGQPVRAVQAMGEVWDNPSLGNAANAALQTGLAATPFMPLKYAAPLIGTDIGLQVAGPSSANAQTPGVEQRLRSMSPAELTAYQRTIGVSPDGRVGPATVAAAQRYEADQQERARQSQESDRIRAQGDAEAARERARILAEAEAQSNRERAASDLSAQEAKRPFLQRNPEYSTYAPFVAGAAAAAIPAVGALLTRKAATAPARQSAQAIDSAVGAFNAAPTPLNAIAVSKAVTPAPAAASAQPTMLNRLMSLGAQASPVALGAAMPSAAAIAPYVIDYMQPPGTEARTQAEKEFTLEKLRERMLGPFALGLTLAGAGKFAGEKGAAAFINPAPAGANLAQAQTIKGIVDRSPDSVALTDEITSLLNGGQTTALAGKYLQGAVNARPPQVTLDDVSFGMRPFQQQRKPAGETVSGSAQSNPSSTAIQPPAGGQIAGSADVPTPEQLLPQPTPNRLHRTSEAPYSPAHSEISRQYIDELVASGQAFPAGRDMAQNLIGMYTAASLPAVNLANLTRLSNATRTAIAAGADPSKLIGRPGFLAIPAAAAASEPINRLMSLYYGQEPVY